MPNINLRDARNRDAQVRAESVRQTATVRYVDKDGGSTQLRTVLKGTLDTSLEVLLAGHDNDLDKLGAALLARDPEIDIERNGTFLSDTSRVYVNDENRIVYRIVQTEIVRAVDGSERERRPKKRALVNVDGDFPLTWTGRKVPKLEALRRFVFFRKLQIVHVNGLTYDFLYGIAKELVEAECLMLLGAGPTGKDPLVMQHGSTPCRGFLEGRIDGNRYVLLLHLSKMELKRPAPVPVAEVVATAPAATAAIEPKPTPAPERQPDPMPSATTPVARKPTVDEVLTAIGDTDAAPSPKISVKAGIGDTVSAAKTAKRQSKAKSAANGISADPAKPAPAKRGRRAKPTGDGPVE